MPAKTVAQPSADEMDAAIRRAIASGKSDAQIAAELGTERYKVRHVRSRLGREALRNPATIGRVVVEVPIRQLCRGAGTQLREEIDAGRVALYAEQWPTKRDEFPPIEVVRTSAGQLVPADGHHRINAAEKAGMETIRAYVRDGTLEDAIELAAAANGRNGLGLNAKEQKTCILALLNIPRWKEASARAIAEHCGFSRHAVAAVLESLAKPLAKRIGADGKQYPAKRPASGGRPGHLAENGQAPVNGHVAAPVDADDYASAERAAMQDAPAESPAEAKESAAEQERQTFLRTIPLRKKLGAACRAVFDADALAWLATFEPIQAVARKAPAPKQVGTILGCYQFLLARFVGTPGPHHWLKCMADDAALGECVDGRVKGGAQVCPSCKGRGYHIPGTGGA